MRRHVQCLWELRDDTPGDAIQTIYPDGRCELLAELGVPLRFHGPDGQVRADQALAFAGQQLGPIRLQAAGPVHCIGVRLSAAAGALVAGPRLPDLRDHAPDLRGLDAAFTPEAHEVADLLTARLVPLLPIDASPDDLPHVVDVLRSAAQAGAGLGIVDARSETLGPDRIGAEVAGALGEAERDLPPMPAELRRQARFLLHAGHHVARLGPDVLPALEAEITGSATTG